MWNEAWSEFVATLAVVMALAAVLVGVVRRHRLRKRSPDSLAGFLRHFDPAEVPEQVTLSVFRHLERWMSNGAERFPVRAGDPLSIYGIAAEDLESTVALLLAESGRRSSGASARELRTVADLVRHIAASPFREPEGRRDPGVNPTGTA